MELGKQQLDIPQVYTGFTAEPTLATLISQLSNFNREIAKLPGTAQMLASTTIAKGQAVNIDSGQLRLADATLSRPAMGIAISAGTAGQPVRFVLGSGYVQGLSGLTPNTIVYLDAAGALTSTRPVSGFVQPIGFALSATELFVHLSADLAPASSGGSALSTTVAVTVPAPGDTSVTATVTFVGCTPAMKVFVALAPALDSEENDPQFLVVQSISAVAGTGQATVSIAFGEITSGPINVHLMAV